MKRLRRVTEPEVIAEFLKNEFHHQEFEKYRQRFERLVLTADISDERENALRRALLFRRRGHMWRELPADTQWWEVEIEPSDLASIRVFPRAHWRRIADDSFALPEVAHRLRVGRFDRRTQAFISKIRALRDELETQRHHSTVLLIGIDEEHPLTILEGNHRLTAALLTDPGAVARHFRVLCGFSPNMRESCWYETNLPNLWRYAKNRLRNLYDRDADLERVPVRLPSELEMGGTQSQTEYRTELEVMHTARRLR
jgi:hypothetical protein